MGRWFFVQNGEEYRVKRRGVRAVTEAKGRASAPGTAPASGRYLERVFSSERELREDLGQGLSR